MAAILLGLDIGTQLIKAVQISKDKGKTYLLAAGYIPSPVNTATVLNRNDSQQIANSINRLVHDMKVTTFDVSSSLPSSKVITRILEIPLMSDKELSSSIQWEAEQYIPWQLSTVKLDYVVVNRDENIGKMQVLLVAAPIALIEKYMEIISMTGLNPVSLEPEIISIARIAGRTYSNLCNVMIFSVGSGTTDICLIKDNSIIYSKSVPIGGQTLTHAIADELGFELTQAEEYKKTYGLDESKLEGKIASIITPLLSNVLQEVERTASFFKERYPKEEIKSVLLSGGAAKLPGLVTYITRITGYDCQVINPFLTLSIDPNIIPVITPDAPVYCAAVGLGIKDKET